MPVDKAINTSMAMNAGTWRRHANAWSVWTRLGAVPLFSLVVYSRIWIGWWALAGVALIALWMFLNVRVFSPAMADSRWEARAIFGEKFWLERKKRSIPSHHLRAITILNVGSGLMAIPMAYGLWTLEPWATALGTLGLVAGQLWALDRYSWVYADLTRGLDAAERSAMVDGGR